MAKNYQDDEVGGIRTHDWDAIAYALGERKLLVPVPLDIPTLSNLS